jgi:hypothetical protein
MARLLRPGDLTPSPDLMSYARLVHPVAQRAADRYADWLDCVRDVTDSADLANAASRQRWQFASDARSLENVEPPTEARTLHRRLIETLQLAARASQLLGVGYRSTRYATVCDGQATLEDAQRALERIAGELARWVPPAELSSAREQPRGGAGRQAS